MIKFAPSRSIYVGVSDGRGLGVFAKKRIKTGDIIESSPTIEIPPTQIKRNHKLFNYVFNNSDNDIVGLGYFSLYNHAKEPNAEVSCGGDRDIHLTAIKPIKPNEEITIKYYEGCEF